MESTERNKEYYSIDLLHILKMLWKRVWLIVLVGVLCAGIGFSIASFVVAPKYSSSIKLYVNNKVDLGNTGIALSASEITAAQSLVKTYIVILESRTTLNMVLEEAGLSDKYTYKDLSGMIEASSVNETEIFYVKVTTENAEDSYLLAKSISSVLKTRIDLIINGADMKNVDLAVQPEKNPQPVSPSVTKYTGVGLLLGVFLTCLILAFAALMDDTIHDEEYISQNYKYPILAKIPDLVAGGSKEYSYYSQKKSTKK